MVKGGYKELLQAVTCQLWCKVIFY